MPLDAETIREVAARTFVVRPPRRTLETFGPTTVRYYLVTEPSYGEENEAVVRSGTVVSERPRLVTPTYLENLFRGFQHGLEFAAFLRAVYGPSAPGLMYQYTNTFGDLEIVSDSPRLVAGRIAERLDREEEPMGAVLMGVDQFWDISLMKFIHDLTLAAAGKHVKDLGRAGLLEFEGNVPREALARIEEMFSAVRAGQLAPVELKLELDRWGLFEAYEDRFLSLFRRPS
jgi:hypothetical protein